MKTKIKSISKLAISLAILLSFTSCGKSDNDYDASGVFEATEVVVSAESTGKIMQFDATEGQQLTENQVPTREENVKVILNYIKP